MEIKHLKRTNLFAKLFWHLMKFKQKIKLGYNMKTIILSTKHTS